MKRQSLIYFVLPVLLIALLSSCNDKPNQQQMSQARPYPVITIPSKDITGYDRYPTKLEGIINSEVRAKTSGYITEVMVDEGQPVKRGQVMFRLETESLNQDAAAAQANVNAAQVEVDKLKPLVEKNIISEVQLESAKARLEQAKSVHKSIEANIGYSTIRSPVDGYVGAINFREGSLVSPTSTQPLTIVADVSKIYAFFSLNEREYLDFIKNSEGETLQEKIKNLPKVKLLLANGMEYPIEGTIETINSQVNASTGSVSFRAVFDNPNHILSSGYSGEIKIPTVYENATLLPVTATYERQGIIYVYQVVGDTLARSQTIDVTGRVDNIYIVKEGIKVGDKIVAQGVARLRNNTPIVPQKVAFDSIARGLQPAFK